jgi:hypothetical protein
VSSKLFVKGLSAILAAAGLLTLASPASAQLLYCCQDAKNNRTCGDSLPPICVGKPYTIRGPGGKLVRQVEAPLTAEQLKAREMLAEKKKAEDEAKFEQGRKDKALLSTYSSESEIDKARDRAEADIEASIKLAEQKVVELEKRKKTAIGDPEMFKKRGLPEDVKARVVSIDLEIKLQNELIEGKKKDLDATRIKYSEDKRRYQEIRERRTVYR